MGEQGRDEDRDDSFDPVTETGGCLLMIPETVMALVGVAVIVYGVFRRRRRG